MIPLINEAKKIHCEQKVFIYVKKDLVLIMKIKNIIKSEIIVIIL